MLAILSGSELDQRGRAGAVDRTQSARWARAELGRLLWRGPESDPCRKTAGLSRACLRAPPKGARERRWRAKSPSADPGLAAQLCADGPGSKAMGVPTNASINTQCGRFASFALKLQAENAIATGEVQADQAQRCGQASRLPRRDAQAADQDWQAEGSSWAARRLLHFGSLVTGPSRAQACAVEAAPPNR